jgi:hypothetical protein
MSLDIQLKNISAQLSEIAQLFRKNIIEEKKCTACLAENLNLKKNEIFVSLGGNCHVAHHLLYPHRNVSYPFDSMGSPSLNAVVDLIGNVVNETFDYGKFFTPINKLPPGFNKSFKTEWISSLEPHFTLIHWFDRIKNEEDKKKAIITFKRRFMRFLQLRDLPVNFVYFAFRKQSEIKNLSSVLESVSMLEKYFKNIKQFIYITPSVINNNLNRINFTDEIPKSQINLVNKWREKGIPEYFKYFCVGATAPNMMGNGFWDPNELLFRCKALNLYEKTGIIEQTQLIKFFENQMIRL